MSKTFVSDPRDVVKSGDVVRVKVLEVDVPRKRISLTLRLDDDATPAASGDRSAPAPGRQRTQPGGAARGRADGGRGRGAPRGGQQQPNFGGALADALRRAGLDKGLDGPPKGR